MALHSCHLHLPASPSFHCGQGCDPFLHLSSLGDPKPKSPRCLPFLGVWILDWSFLSCSPPLTGKQCPLTEDTQCLVGEWRVTISCSCPQENLQKLVHIEYSVRGQGDLLQPGRVSAAWARTRASLTLISPLFSWAGPRRLWLQVLFRRGEGHGVPPWSLSAPRLP